MSRGVAYIYKARSIVTCLAKVVRARGAVA